MDAGSEDWLIAFAYASDFASFPGTKLVAGDAKWIPGMILGADIKAVPRTVVQSSPFWYANNANPAGVNLGKHPIDGTFSFTVVMLDNVIAYLIFGKATADTPGADVWRVQGSTDGAIPALIAEVENNRLYAKQARQFEDVRFVKASIVTVPFKAADGSIGMFLAFDVNAIARREYTETAQNTATITYRGTDSPDLGYNIFGNSMTGFAFTWDSKDLTKWICGIKSDITNDISNVLRMDNNLFAGLQANGGKRKFGKPVFKLLQKMTAAGDLDDLEALRGVDKSDIVLKVPRRNANDYITITWKDVYLLDIQHEPCPKGTEGDKYTTLTFSEPTDILFDDACNDGSATPHAVADYEQ
jgi:hypothetical protein